jgi:hypothetical protein
MMVLATVIYETRQNSPSRCRTHDKLRDEKLGT